MTTHNNTKSSNISVVGSLTAETSTVPSHENTAPVFVTGSTMRHVLVMTITGSIGLMAIFFVDLISLFYISRLGDNTLTAGVGYASVILFFATSINIGLMIGVSALTGRNLGAGKRDEAIALGSSGLAFMCAVSLLITGILMISASKLLSVIGAQGAAFDVALRFLYITLPSNMLMALGMGFSGILRAVGDAKRAMWVTLIGGIVTAVLDPIFIFWLNWGVDGAAVVIVISRLCFAVVGLYGAFYVHRLVNWPHASRLISDIKSISVIAGPAILTNLATPFANLFIAASLARFGDQAVAAGAVIDRLVVVAFGGLFALSGAVGPILSQNFGAGQFERMRTVMKDCVIVSTVYVCFMWLLLILGRDLIGSGFQATGLKAEIIAFFCWISGFMWLTLGLLFTANACYNNLGFPLQATAFNWGRATFGTIPFAMVGAWWMGAKGIYLGITLGAAIFGIYAFWVAYKLITKLELKTMPTHSIENEK